MEKHGKGLTSEHFFMEGSKGLFQTETLGELRNKLRKWKKQASCQNEKVLTPWALKKLLMLLKNVIAKLLKIIYNLSLKTALVSVVHITTIFKKILKQTRELQTSKLDIYTE